MITGVLLARRGHEVLLVDRDPGPGPDGVWRRRGVMQFHHAHAFRVQVSDALSALWPEALAAWEAAGAEPAHVAPPGSPPGSPPVLIAHRSRRELFETALRAQLVGEPGLTLARGHVDNLVVEEGRARGVVVAGSRVDAELVVDATGRSGRAFRAARGGDAVGGVCGQAYVDRLYRLREGAGPGPLLSPIAWQGDFDGYQTLLFLHDQGYFSVLFLRPTADEELKRLRHQAAFEAACRAVPGLAEWTDPARALPASPVYPGGELRNAFRPQADLPGLLAVGDAVATTTPSFGRGIATLAMQLLELARLLDEGTDPREVARPFGGWCETAMRPWVADHVAMDTDQVRRWQGGDVDLTRPLPSDLVVAAGDRDPAIAGMAGGYLAMQQGPAVLDRAQPLARAVYASGWRRPWSAGPTRDELVELIRAAA